MFFKSAAMSSQENAIENVKLQISGDSGQTIRQLMQTHLIHRCALTPMNGTGNRKRQNVLVCHDRCKISVFQLSGLTKGIEASRKRLAASVSFVCFFSLFLFFKIFIWNLPIFSAIEFRNFTVLCFDRSFKSTQRRFRCLHRHEGSCGYGHLQLWCH